MYFWHEASLRFLKLAWSERIYLKDSKLEFFFKRVTKKLLTFKIGDADIANVCPRTKIDRDLVAFKHVLGDSRLNRLEADVVIILSILRTHEGVPKEAVCP